MGVGVPTEATIEVTSPQASKRIEGDLVSTPVRKNRQESRFFPKGVK